MLRSSVKGLRRLQCASRAIAAPAVVGLGLWIGFPTTAAYQDMASLVSGAESGAGRWAAFLEPSVAGSVHQAEMPFVDGDLTTGAISGAGMRANGIGAVAFRKRTADPDLPPDEARVNRADKKGRLAETLPVAPPRLFNAGSIFERTSSLLAAPPDGSAAMAFVVPKIQGKEVQIASAFHLRAKPQDRFDLPPMIARLVTNDRPDVLATAYAPAEPDYAEASPFASLLANEDEQAGRFIPPVDRGDHAWARRPLPASVFSAREQQCLAAGIYFEARGEPVEGQAAVAQVILNRVRNPAYPGSICGVVYQNKSWRNRCQFSFACDGIRDRVLSPRSYETAETVGLAVTAGKIWIEEVGSSTHYHATYVNPRWARAMQRMQRIGQHIFYRTRGGGWN